MFLQANSGIFEGQGTFESLRAEGYEDQHEHVWYF